MIRKAPLATRVWSGIEAEYPPVFRHDYPELLAMAQMMLESRKRRFPAMISAGALDAASAQQEITTFAAILADWQWIVTGEGQPASPASLAQRMEVLDTSLTTIAGIARQKGRFSPDLEHQTNCVIAMRWHLQPGSALGVQDCARITHDLRREMKGKPHAN